MVASFLRFNNLMWGDGHFFHPDENNMARSVAQMTFENGLHPDFFAYGQLPLYLAFFSALIANYIQLFFHYLLNSYSELQVTSYKLQDVTFQEAIFFLRFWSAIASVISVYLVYRITRTIASEKYALLAALLTAFTPGLIQAAHFGTTESLLTYFFLLILFFCIKIVQSKSDFVSSSRLFVLLGISFGLSVGIKLTAVYFFVSIGMTILLYLNRIRAQKQRFALLHRLLLVLLVVVSTLLGYSISSPHNLISYKEFGDSIRYEINVAQGLDVFYTRQFEGTTPFLFQITHIFPYTLGWALFVIGSISLLYALFKAIQDLFHFHTANRTQMMILIILLVSFFSFLIFNSILYVKWTRFLTPLFPFFSVFVAITAGSIVPSLTQYVEKNYKSYQFLYQSILIVIIMYSLVPGIRFNTIYARKDTRVQASEWIYENIPQGSYILSETANVVDIPVGKIPASPAGRRNYTVISFNFYELDHPSLRNTRYEELLIHLEKADYIFVPSRRIFANHMRFPEKYPVINAYYEALFDGRLGFKQVHTEEPMLNDESAEETWTVFDHPTIRIYNKTTPKTRNEYGKILNQSISL